MPGWNNGQHCLAWPPASYPLPPVWPGQEVTERITQVNAQQLLGAVYGMWSWVFRRCFWKAREGCPGVLPAQVLCLLLVRATSLFCASASSFIHWEYVSLPPRLVMSLSEWICVAHPNGAWHRARAPGAMAGLAAVPTLWQWKQFPQQLCLRGCLGISSLYFCLQLTSRKPLTHKRWLESRQIFVFLKQMMY